MACPNFTRSERGPWANPEVSPGWDIARYGVPPRFEQEHHPLRSSTCSTEQNPCLPVATPPRSRHLASYASPGGAPGKLRARPFWGRPPRFRTDRVVSSQLQDVRVWLVRENEPVARQVGTEPENKLGYGVPPGDGEVQPSAELF